jgi:RNA polymerase sigma factor (sigma-70 family)
VGFAELDLELVTRSQSGDPAAFDSLCSEVGSDLYRFLLAHLRNHDDADDAYQEVLIRVHRHLPRLREPRKFPGWVKRIAINQCHTLRARAARKSLASWDALEETPDIPETVWQPQGVETPRQAALRGEMGEQINQAIVQLPPRQRTCLVLFEVEGHSIRDIAETLGCSQGAVKFNLHQARKKLQGSLKQYLRSEDSPAEAVAAEGGG